MYKKLITLLLLVTPFITIAQILPKEGSDLNYRLVAFSFPRNKSSTVYKLEIAEGNYKNAALFKKNVIVSAKSSSNKVVAEVPAFGAEYTWHIVYDSAKKKESPLYHFTTQKTDRIDTTKYRLKILQPTTGFKDMFVAIDAGGVFYDVNGIAMAFLPEVNNLGGFVADLEFTKDSTMTFNFIRSGYETNLNGDIIWQAPKYNPVNGGTVIDVYHHNITKLSNGNYMLLGMEFIPSKAIIRKDTSYISLRNETPIPEGYSNGVYGTIIEFDKAGNVVWSWKDSKHLLGTDFDYFNPQGPDTVFRFDPHSNSFYYDEQNGFVYLSYRNLNRIIKIDYATGKIVETYGDVFKPGMTSQGGGFFCNPHGIRRSAEGNLYFFNNNSCRNTDSMPSVVVFKEPAYKGDSVKKVWEYICTMQGNYSKRFGAGGNAIELPDRSMFVCMGNEFTKLFIVSPEKKELWAGLPERHVETDNVWVPVKQYRANIITRKELEQLIWKAEASIKVEKRSAK